MKPVLVIWNDAHGGTFTWERIEDLVDDEPYRVQSVGYLLLPKAGGKRGHVSIAQSWSTDECVDSVLHIPTKMVVKVVILSEEPIEYIHKTSANSVALPATVNPKGS